MTETICGHDRDVLIWALDELARHPFENVKTVAIHMGDDFGPTVCDCDDPAKLAEMMAEEAHRFNMVFRVCGVISYSSGPKVDFDINDNWSWSMTNTQARRILLQWFQFPDGARDDAERVLRDTT